MAAKQLIAEKLKRTIQNARKAWWVLLFIVAYMVFAWVFLGTNCFFASTVGIPCPGCGGTRAVAALFQGDLSQSLHYHPLLIPSVLFFIAYTVVSFTREQKPPYLERVLIIYGIILLGVYAVRMILMFPDEPPMVINEQAILMRFLGLFR